ncbi:MAG: hypothetical protein IJQ40_01840 [Bacilli bacterium]|nr:hypothetical protein [Bacilli bacterium]
MKYLLLGDDYKKLFIEDDKQFISFRYDANKEQWVPGGTELFDNRVGFDASEPEGSPYRFGSLSCMKDIVEITKEDAEIFIGKSIDEKKVLQLFDC